LGKKEENMNTYFTASERDLLMMLLQKEEKDLSIEISHIFQREFKNILRERLTTVTALLEKLKINEPAFA
jgi:hypothetical protein